MMITILDTHAHYDDEAFDADREAVIASLPGVHSNVSATCPAEQSSAHDPDSGSGAEPGEMLPPFRVDTVVNMGASLRGAARSLELARQWPFICAGCGIHPDHVGILEYGTDHAHEEADASGALLLQTDPQARAREAWEKLTWLCRDDRCVTVGEIGLDYHWMVEPKEIQRKWFIRQLELAKELGKPINVHSRNAKQDTFDVIMENHADTTGGIIHCFSGSVELAKEYVKHGYCLGIGGAVTYPHSKTLKKVVAAVPIEYLVTETDSPYMTPEPVRSINPRNDSANIIYVIREIARIKGMDTEETARILYENGRRVYRLA